MLGNINWELFSKVTPHNIMSNMLLAVSAAGVAVMLMVLSYPSLSDYAEYRIARTPFDSLAEAEPIFEPRIVEPLVDMPGIHLYFYHAFGYVGAEHHPEDDSVTITYNETDAEAGMPWCGHPIAGDVHTQTYHVNQTFAYCCGDFEDRTKMLLYQYRGTSMFQGERSLVLAHFEADVPRSVPCTFPDFLVNTVDVYDAGDFDMLYDLDHYRGPPEGKGNHYITHVEPIRHAVVYTPIYIDPKAISSLGDRYWEGRIYRIAHNPDDSLTVTYRDKDPATFGAIPGTDHVITYAPGQSFLVDCRELEDTTTINVYNYRGSETLSGNEMIILVNFKAYTRVPTPCPYPDFLDYSIDVFDIGRLDRQYDMEWYRE